MRNERVPGHLARLRTVTGVVAAVALATVGCGAGSGTTTAQAAGCVAPGVTPSQITLGVAFPNSGSYASILAPYRSGIDARLGVANAAGGVNGRKIVYNWADDQGLATGNLGAAQRLVNQQHVFGLMELSTASAGSAAFLHAQGVPVVGIGADVAWSVNSNMFSWWNTVSTGAPVSTMGDYIHVHGGTKAVILYSDLAQATKIISSQWMTSLKADGISVGAIEATPNITSPADVAAEIKAGGYDTVVNSVDDTLFTQITIALKQTDPRANLIISDDGYSGALLDAVGKVIPGFTVGIPYLPFEMKASISSRFLAAMSRYSPQVQPSANQIALYGWLDADLMLTGLKAAGTCPTRAGFIRSLRDIRDYNASGLLAAPVNFKTDFGQTSRCLIFVRIAPTGDRWDVVRPFPVCGRRLT
jgi:branched-chain amino acid transport system substrate-binding protein